MATLSSFLLNLSFSIPVMSISPEEVRNKLGVIAVFVLTDEKGNLYDIKRDDTVVVPLYLRLSDARRQLTKVVVSSADSKARIQAYALNVFFEKANELRKSQQLIGKSLDTPIVVPEYDMSKAIEILKTQGVSVEKIKAGLRVPVFFAEPMISARTSNGDRQVFFISYSQLKSGLAALPATQRKAAKERVADLQVVLDLIENSEEDVYEFMASEGFLGLRKSYLESQKDLQK